MSTSTEVIPALPDGQYEIQNQGTGTTVSRYHAEFADLRPKAVFALGSETKPTGKWQIEKKKNGKYTLKIVDPVGPLKDDEGVHVYAFVNGPDGSVDWEITEVISTKQEKGWIIETTVPGGEKHGWSATGPDDNRGIQIAVKRLPSTFSLPPQYFPTDVFQFTRIDREN